MLYFSSPLRAAWIRPGIYPWGEDRKIAAPSVADSHLTPIYPTASPLDDILRLVTPGSDEYIIEGYAAEIAALLKDWSRALLSTPPGTEVLGTFLDASISCGSSFIPAHESDLRPGDRIGAWRRTFSREVHSGREKCLDHIKQYLSALRLLEVADFEIYECVQTGDTPLRLDAKVRYNFLGGQHGGAREERIGSWLMQWSQSDSGEWQIRQWTATEEIVTRAAGPFFIDITAQALGQTSSYREQLRHGADYWRTVLDGALGVDVYGNNGVAVGDFDSDGRDDLYVCQPSGLPNRLYRNRGDGTFEDVTEKSGVGLLDFTACALFADFQNRGLQDLLVVGATGPILFSNNGNGTFSVQPNAFRFARPPQGAFTHAAIADYDHDGRLDVYFCLYTYYQGLDQYHYPVPYFDARNGPPNYLFHNEGNGVFQDRTQAAGLDVENDRYSFACSWGDCNGDGWPDLYVVNDFGRNCLYRNNKDGTFSAISDAAQVDEAGAGMSSCWLDFNNNGKQDIYAAGMWVAAGMRVFGDARFHGGEPEKIRAIYRRHMTGNSLYENRGGDKFQNVAPTAGVDVGRWSWSTDSWDFDHDGFPDLYVANGYITGMDWRDASSFFWRQVVAKSPADSTPSPEYERGWGAMNELIRSDATWNGSERNVFFANNRDGTFTDVSGVVGLDFRDDSRAFALADFDGDGRLELLLKNRTGPQLRILRLAASNLGNVISFRLQGRESNRDAIGAAITVDAGTLRQTKYLQAGSGFLSQHTKEVFFGLGNSQGPVRATVKWPSGKTETFENMPINQRVEIREGTSEIHTRAFSASPPSWSVRRESVLREAVPPSIGTWLIEPIPYPEFSLPELAGNLRDLRSLLTNYLLMTFWKADSSACRDQLRQLKQSWTSLSPTGLRVAALNVDNDEGQRAAQSFARAEALPFPVLLASSEAAGIYNLLYRYMFDRHRDLPLPTSFLIDASGNILKVYQGVVDADSLLRDLASVPATAADRMARALPFPGLQHRDSFQRNAFTYGVAFFQHGFLDQAERSFKQVIAIKPDAPEAYYNLGTLYLRQNSLQAARENLEQTVKLRPEHPEAWNNLGMLAAQEGKTEEAITCFQRSLQSRPRYGTALVNLGNLYRRQGNLSDAETSLKRAVESEPKNPEASYGLGMLYARRDQADQAVQYLENAIALRPDYSDALNNLGVLLVQHTRYQEAEGKFKLCIQRTPNFDQAYLNLARLYLVMNKKEEARTVLQSLLQKQPQHKMAQQMLQLLY